MLKIFLTADNHIGLKYANHPSADILSSNRIFALEGMVEMANAESCSLFVIAGDLFENTRSMTNKAVTQILEILSRFNEYVVVMPGNHDYYDKGVKVWQQFQNLNTYDNIMLLTDFRQYEVTVNGKQVVLYPALCTSLHSAPCENNLDWIKDAEISSDTYNIGIAHGSVEGETIDEEGKYFPMERSELEEIPVDVWLLGHTHVPFPRDITLEFSNCGRIFNPGTHVQTDVSCNTEGLGFIIEIDDDKTVRAKKYVSGNMRFYRKSVTLKAGEMEQILKRELEKIGDDSVVDLILEGAVTPEEYEARAEVVENALSRFIEGTYNDSKLCRLITKELINSEFPETSFSARLLAELLDDPQEAQLAYDMLKQKKEGK